MVNFKGIFLAIAIAIVFVFFVGFGIAAFYKSPQYEDFCTREAFPRSVPLEKIEPEACIEIEQSNLEFQRNCKGDVVYDIDDNGCRVASECSMCGEQFDDTREIYNRNVFIVATGIGIITLILGFALHLASVSSGLMGGGILTIIYGTIRYWTDLPDYGRFIILGITLGILIWMGYKKIKK